MLQHEICGHPKINSSERLKELVERNRRSRGSGVYSVCSAHPSVIEAVFHNAIADQAIFCVESTSSQVNQEGGYTGQTPREFSGFIHCAASTAGFPPIRSCWGETIWALFPGEISMPPLQWKEPTS